MLACTTSQIREVAHVVGQVSSWRLARESGLLEELSNSESLNHGVRERYILDLHVTVGCFFAIWAIRDSISAGVAELTYGVFVKSHPYQSYRVNKGCYITFLRLCR